MINGRYLETWFQTVKYLKTKQIYFRVYYPVKRFFHNIVFSWQQCHISAITPVMRQTVNFQEMSYQKNLYQPATNTFTLINKSVSFGNSKINWECDNYGKLWTFHLNYFEWLNDTSIPVAAQIATIRQFMESVQSIQTVSMASYPTSLRIINWIKFIIKHQITDRDIFIHLKRQSMVLYAFPEYGTMGNHLLENGFAMIFAGCFFNDGKLFKKGKKIITEELEEQILSDGGHFERSSSYHLLLLQRAMECIQLLLSHPDYQKDQLILLVKNKASIMLSWINNLKLNEEAYACFSDSACTMAPTIAEIKNLAQNLEIVEKEVALSESGFRKMRNNYYHIVFNCGGIKASYQPGHSHADALSFCLYFNKKPLVVNRGISTYDDGKTRLQERSTCSQNTVCINNTNMHDVWKSFRVGNRANVMIVKDTGDSISAEHDGYKLFHAIHTRTIALFKDELILTDAIRPTKNTETLSCISRLHFHPDNVPIVYENAVQLGDARIELKNLPFYCEEYLYNEGFNQSRRAWRIVLAVGRHAQISFTANDPINRYHRRNPA